MPVATFPLKTLPQIQNGEKRATIRYDARLKSAKAGDTLTMQFGARNKPTTLRVTIREVVKLERPLAWMESWPDSDPKANAENDELTELMRAGSDFEREFVRAVEASGCTVQDVLMDLMVMERADAFVLYFDPPTP